MPAPSPGTGTNLTGVSGHSSDSVWAVGNDTPAGATAPQTLTLSWNGTTWSAVPSPDPAGFGQLDAVSGVPGTATVWAVGTDPAGTLALQNG